MLTIVQSWRLNVLFRKLPAVFISRERPTELRTGRPIHYNEVSTSRSDGAAFQSKRHSWDLLLDDIQRSGLKSAKGRAVWCSSPLLVPTVPVCIVWSRSNCDAVIRRPGRIWGVWESHERNDAMLGNQFLAGDNTSRIRTCFIKQRWL